MKHSHMLTILLLVALVCAGWFSVLTGFGDSETAEFRQHMDTAGQYYEKGLFWKAGQEYFDALTVSGTEEHWRTMLEAFSSSYVQGDDCYDDYLDAAQAAVQAYGSNEDFVMQLVSLYLDEDQYEKAMVTLKNAIASDVDSDAVFEKLNDVAYAYKLVWGTYDEVTPFINGYYQVYSNGMWSYLDFVGDQEKGNSVVALGPVGEDDIRVMVYEELTILIDEDGVPQGIIRGAVEKVGVYAEGLIPVQRGGNYSYYSLLGDEQFGSYTMAGTFAEGLAAVQTDDAAWRLVNQQGETEAEGFQDIILNNDGSWICDDVMLAQRDGKYRLYNEKLEQISDFSCDDVDIVCEDSMIAFCSGNKWGFVDDEGKVVIEPVFAEARSFSNGLAAVFDGTAWGFINPSGEIVIDCQFQDAGYFTEKGSCMVLTDDGWKLLMRYVTD